MYDAAGSKLQKITVEGSSTTVTTYIGGFVYVNNVLQFMPQEEGRIRVVGSTTKAYVFDYPPSAGLLTCALILLIL